MSLSISISECQIALDLFLNNEFKKAQALLKPKSTTSMYHALGYAVLLYIQAVLTFDRDDLQIAVEAIKNSMELNDQFRKKRGVINRALRRPNYFSYSYIEAHAELNYAESLLMRGIISFVEDENLMNFIRGGIRIKYCYNSYRECLHLLEDREWADGEGREDFESGVRMGVGVFNLVISQLPTRILKLLEFIGFKGNKDVGLQHMKEASTSPTLRSPLCSLMLMAYHTFHTYVFGIGDGDLCLCDELMKPLTKRYPLGALILFFRARIAEVKGNINEAVSLFEKGISCQSEWIQFHHLCYWELMWCHSFRSDWTIAYTYAKRLYTENRWSKAFYLYQEAAFLSMMEIESVKYTATIQEAYRLVPRLKQRIAGKSIPTEKFVVKKAERYVAQGRPLLLPALEMIYLWNGFIIMGRNRPLIDRIYEIIVQQDQLLEKRDKFYVDDKCLLLLLSGMCLKCKGESDRALENFMEIKELSHQIKEDHFLLPYSLLETACIYMERRDRDGAERALADTKSYKGYSLESRLHFRVHAAHISLARRGHGGRKLSLQNSLEWVRGEAEGGIGGEVGITTNEGVVYNGQGTVNLQPNSLATHDNADNEVDDEEDEFYDAKDCVD